VAIAIDPICGMDVDVTRVKYKVTHMEKTYYFCNRMCMETFESNPNKWMTN
jgi:Cu+-exporting ATPase